MKKTKFTLLALGAVALAASSLLDACIKSNADSPGWEYMPDMYRSPSIETNGINTWEKDSVGNLTPPAGTIARGWMSFPYANTADDDTLASKFWMNPIAHSDSMEDQGKALYERFCVYCHGAKGDGQGPLVSSKKYMGTPPNYPNIKDRLTDGHVYFVITYGKNAMGSHASQISPEERCKIVQYVQRLARGGMSWSDYQKSIKDKMMADSAAKDTLKVKPMHHK